MAIVVMMPMSSPMMMMPARRSNVLSVGNSIGCFLLG